MPGMKDMLELSFHLPEVAFDAGDTVAKAHATDGAIWLRASGALQVRNGTLVVDAITPPRGLIGEISVPLDTAYAATVEATASSVLRLAADGLALPVGDPSGGQWQTRQSARPSGPSHHGQMPIRVSSVRSESPARASGPVRSWWPELITTRPAACRSASWRRTTTDCAFSGSDEPMSSGSPAITTRSQGRAARTRQSSWRKVWCKSETRRMRTGPFG